MNGEIIAIPIIFGTVAYTIITLTKLSLGHIRNQKLAELQSATMTRIVDKLGSGPELLSWLQTGDLKKFLDVERAAEAAPHSRILNAVQAGTVLTALGGGMYLVPRTESNWETLGLISPQILALGIGFLLAAVASYLLSAKLGLMAGKPPARQD